MQLNRDNHLAPVSLLFAFSAVFSVVSVTPLAAQLAYNSPGVALNGAWTQQTDMRAASGGYAVSNTAGNTVTLQFTGDSITLYRRVDVDGGTAGVAVDNNMVGSFSFYFPSQQWRIPAVLDHLGAGPHTLVLTVSGQMPAGSTGQNVYIDNFVAPSGFAPSAAQQAALTRVNQYRAQMGIPAAQLSTALDMAAQGHADYNAMSGILAHIEAFGNPGFIGVSFGDRAGYFGYDSPTSEDAHQLGDPSGAVDGWMNTLYHRAPIAAYLNTDIGYGLSLLNNKTMDVMDFGAKSSKAPATRAIVTYPANNQTDVPVAWSEESPDPLPGVPRPLGYPLSVHIAQPANVTQGTDTVVTSGTLTDSNNQNVPVNFLDRNSDPNMFLRDEYFIVPQQPLNVGAKYQASVSGTDTQGNAFNVSWSFTTVPASGITSVIPFAGTPNSIWIQWTTAGAVQTTQLQFGTTTAYGMPLMGTPNNATNPNSYAVNLTGLTPATTYHYQIAATDAQGNARTTADATFTTAAQ